MGDFRIVIEAVGGHGCGRGTFAPGYLWSRDPARAHNVIQRCHSFNCPDCMAEEFVKALMAHGVNVHNARLEHWPIPGAAGTSRTDHAGPIDDLLNSRRDHQF